jgi:hypothetical protein
MGSKELAAIYARLSEVEAHATGMEKATTIRFDEVAHEMERLQSNSETQKKVLAQELGRIEVQTQSAVDRAQTQIDSLRQQTTDMHTSLAAIHEHSTTLTASLKNMMQSFKDLRFELPNAFDHWMTVKAGGQNGTVSGAELQPWNSSMSLPPVSLPPPLQVRLPPPAPSPPANTIAPETNTGSIESPHRTPAPNTAGPPNSPNDSYQGFMAPYMEHSDAMRDLNHNLDNGGTGDMDVDQVNLNLEGAAGIQQMDQELRGQVVEQEGRMEPMRQAERATTEHAERATTETEQAEQHSTPDRSGAESVPASTSAIAETGGAIVTDENMPQTQEGTSGNLSNAPPVEETNVSQPLTPGQSQRTPPSTPPTFIRDHSVPPPSGMLVSNYIEVLPPSSQSSLASPSPQPNYRLLNQPRAGDETRSTGPMTRSRSRSRSPNPPVTEPTVRPGPVRRKSSRKAAGGK